jgi:hypothetical protein
MSDSLQGNHDSNSKIMKIATGHEQTAISIPLLQAFQIYQLE